MTAPNIKIQFPLPDDGMIPVTYPEFLDKINCSCPGGAIISPSPLPSATKNLGDIIASQAQYLSYFTSAYGMVTVVIRMMACIIDVICSLMNPFSVIFAIIRLFGTCLPQFILIFPQFAIPAIIICILKIVLAIVEYVLEVIVPIINDIISNITSLVNAFNKRNADAQQAIAFKIVSLIKELQNIIGILSALGALWQMVKALMDLGIAIPCGGSGGSCSGCGDDQCPSTLKQTEINGTDGVMIVLYGETAFDFQLRFFSSLKQTDFLTIKNFFPKGFDFNSVTQESDVPYTLTVDANTYMITGVDSGGTANISYIQPEFEYDGYLSSVYSGGPISDPYVRFATDTYTFSSSYVGKYIEIEDERGGTYAESNNGVWEISSVYDAYNILVDRGSDSWNVYNTLDPNAYIKWRVKPSVPSSGGNKIFKLEINHAELIRHDLIGLGCHPAVQATMQGFNNRFPDASNLTLPILPDLDLVITNANYCISSFIPASVDSQWVLDNYGQIASNITGVDTCLTGILNGFKNDMVNYVKDIYSKVIDRENSIFSASPMIQLIGSYSNISVIPLDKNGGRLSLGLPPGTIDVNIETDNGELSSVVEVLDAYGATTGEFTAKITNDQSVISSLMATIDGYYISIFDGYDLNPKVLEIEFVESFGSGISRSEGSSEPLGVGNG